MLIISTDFHNRFRVRFSRLNLNEYLNTSNVPSNFPLALLIESIKATVIQASKMQRRHFRIASSSAQIKKVAPRPLILKAESEAESIAHRNASHRLINTPDFRRN